MAKYESTDIRNIALVGHAGTGKTMLADMMLFKAGATKRVGRSLEGTSVFDFLPEEKEKGSVNSAIAHCRWREKELNIIDTAGRQDFVGTVVSALAAVETAVIVISATAGIEVNTRRAWQRAEEAGVARLVAINKLDGENIDLPVLLEEIQQLFGKKCVPLTLPIGIGRDFKGVASVLTAAEAPDGVIGDIEAGRQALMEAVVEADDQLLEKYLAEEEITPEELNAAFVIALTGGTCVPILCCSAEKGEGVEELLDVLANFAPSPVQGLKRKARLPESEEDPVEVEAKADAPFRAQVFKIIMDDYAGKIIYFRVYSGTLNGNGSVFLPRTGRNEKVAQLLRPMGRETGPIEVAIPGDIVAAAKVDEAMVNDTLCANKEKLVFAPIPFPNPMVGLAVQPETQKDEQKISGALAKLAQEDPTFLVDRQKQTHELVITGMSNLHLTLMLHRLRERFQVGVNTKDPKIAYRETVTALGDAHYRHKKQTGGRGQFGEVYLKVEPLERGNRFEFVDDIYGGSIPNQYLPAVEKGVVEAMEKGVVAGYPVHDVRVRVYDGKHHEVDSSEAAFKIAGARAFKLAFLAAKPMLLEPIVTAEITVPSKFTGDILGDLNSRRGRIQSQNSLGDLQVITAEIPMAEMTKYSTQLDSVTGGQGSYSMEFSRYDYVPARIGEGIIGQSKPAQEEDED